MDASYTVRWFVTIFIGLTFAATGALKLFGDPVFTSWFYRFGFPLEYMRAIGVIEIVCAMALCVPLLARYATLGLLAIAMGATATQLWLGNPLDAVLPTVLATAAAIAIWGVPGHPVSAPEPKLLTDAVPAPPSDFELEQEAVPELSPEVATGPLAPAWQR